MPSKHPYTPGVITVGPATVMYDSALAASAYGASRSVPPVLTRRDTPIRSVRTPGVSVDLYDTALTAGAYGTPQLGDLFNDVMGAVVPGWDKRPDWMKKIQVKPDPAKLFQAASKVVPPSQVNRVLDAAQEAGVNLYYQTPAGQVPITSQTAGALYGGYPMFAQAQSTLSSVPVWVWAAGAGVLALLLMRK